jgi:hypothetical protein
MTQRQDAILIFGLMMLSGAVILPAVSWGMLGGFILGFVQTIVAATVASGGHDFDDGSGDDLTGWG